ncbi:hypothetical protein FQA39_LY13135 [Lamprigera yunnana]|nr:hypothetical protein FQA39_LY13135 [Lamprigera yunnana]
MTPNLISGMPSMEKEKQRAHSSDSTRTLYDLSKLTLHDVLELFDSISDNTDIENDGFDGHHDDDDSVAEP